VSGFLVLVAAELEARGLARNLGLRRLTASPWSRFGADGLEVQVVGLRAAGLAARGLGAGDPPDLLISAGSCGALSPALARTGALVLPALVLPPAGPPLAVDRGAHTRALAAAARAGLAPATGPLATVEEVVDTPTAKAALAHRTGAIAVDMESAVILAVARERGLAAIVVRGVSDTADQSLPPGLARLVDAGGQTRPARAAALVLRRPALLGQAWALRRGILLALTAVAVVIRELGETG
jgi:adenosylhomocysteine nucleosidase